MLKLLFIFHCALIYICASVQASENLVEVFKWKQIEFATKNTNTADPSSIVFPDMFDNIRNPKNFYANNKYNNNGNTNTENMIDYVAYNNVPMGVSHYKDKLFVTIPRRRTGIPATLNYIDLSSASLNSSPKFNPYPDYEYNELQSSQRNKNSDNSFISVYRTRVDYSCDRLWFIDTGMLEYPNNRTQVQQPSIWVFDLKTNKKIKRFEIPQNIVSDGRGLASITVDSQPGNCDNAFAYIPDLYTYRLYVYSFRNDRIWTFQHNFFNFDPLSGDLDIAGQKFQWNDGIFSITLGKRNPNGFRTAYFHPMVSTSEFSVSTEVLQDETRAERSYHGNDFKHLGNRGPNRQSTMHDCDPNTGIIMYAEIANYGVGCWNTNKMFSAQNHVTLERNEKTMIYPSDLTIDSNGVMWMMTNSMPLFIYSSLNPNEYNFRIWKQNVHKATENTVCDANNRNYLHTSSYL